MITAADLSIFAFGAVVGAFLASVVICLIVGGSGEPPKPKGGAV